MVKMQPHLLHLKVSLPMAGGRMRGSLRSFTTQTTMLFCE